MKNMIQRKNKKGFTLVELVIVIAVLAILAAVAVPTVTNVVNDANESTDKANAQTIELALKSGYAEAIAKTWKVDGETADTITVTQALDHAGLGDELPALKTNSYSWEYTSDGKITVNGSGTDELKVNTPLGNIFNHS